MRSAPAVMVPELTDGVRPDGRRARLAVGLFYYAYAPFSLVAGVAMDQLGPRKVVPLGAATRRRSARLLFATGDPTLASIGRFLQGAGGVFALIGAAYIATTYFPASRAATLIGATQMFGMAGGSAGQFVVGPAIAGGLALGRFWLVMGIDRRPDRRPAVPVHSQAPGSRPPTPTPRAGTGSRTLPARWGRCSATRSRSCAA